MIKDKLKEKLILNRLDNVYCRLAPSKIHGVGIFAIKDIPKGINPFKQSYMAQDAITVDKKKVKDIEILNLLNDYHPSENNIQVISLYPNQLIWTNYINYSEFDNIELHEDGEWRTTRLIKKGEEILENPKKLFNSDGTHKVFRVKLGQYPSLT